MAAGQHYPKCAFLVLRPIFKHLWCRYGAVFNGFVFETMQLPFFRVIVMILLSDTNQHVHLYHCVFNVYTKNMYINPHIHTYIQATNHATKTTDAIDALKPEPVRNPAKVVGLKEPTQGAGEELQFGLAALQRSKGNVEEGLRMTAEAEAHQYTQATTLRQALDR